MRRVLTSASLLIAVLFLAGRASAAQISVSTGGHGIDVKGDRVLIHHAGDPDAEISPGGGLRIGGRTVVVAERDRVLLERYDRRVHRIEDRAIDVGIDGAQLGITALAAAVVAVVTGNHQRVEDAVRPDAEALREKAMRICKDVEELRSLQDQIAADVPAFRPYAAIEAHDLAECRAHEHMDATHGSRTP